MRRIKLILIVHVSISVISWLFGHCDFGNVWNYLAFYGSVIFYDINLPGFCIINLFYTSKPSEPAYVIYLYSLLILVITQIMILLCAMGVKKIVNILKSK